MFSRMPTPFAGIHVRRRNVTISAKPLDDFWMNKAYRVPAGLFPVADPFTSQNNAES